MIRIGTKLLAAGALLVAPLAFAAEPAASTAASPAASPAAKSEAAKPAAKPATKPGMKAGNTEVTWYGHATFTVKTPGGTVLVLDPWFDNPSAKDKNFLPEKADFILASHGHFDHVGSAVAVAKKTGAKLVGSFELGQALVALQGFPKDQATMMTLGNAGGTIKLNDEVSVAIVPAVHSSGVQKDDASPAQYGGSPVGFVIQIKDGPTIYHSGDTDVFGDMKLVGERYKIDLALLCIGGHFTMDPTGAALAASMLHPKEIVPMHYGTFPVLTGTPAELEKELKAKHVAAKVVNMTVGEPMKF